MVRPRYKPVSPDKRIRELRKEFKQLRKKEEPGAERAEKLAVFTHAAHAERQLNMAMHTATMCLEEDPDAPEMLVAAYVSEPDDREDLLRRLLDLKDLARYVDDEGLRTYADERFDDEARDWIASGSDGQQRHRLRVLSSLVSREYADTIRDELRFL